MRLVFVSLRYPRLIRLALAARLWTPPPKRARMQGAMVFISEMTKGKTGLGASLGEWQAKWKDLPEAEQQVSDRASCAWQKNADPVSIRNDVALHAIGRNREHH